VELLMLALACQHEEILGVIVAPVPIHMVDGLSVAQWPSEFVLRDQAMLHDIAIARRGTMIGYVDPYVAVWVDRPAALPLGRLFHPPRVILVPGDVAHKLAFDDASCGLRPL
jgi:hypothetical protein